VVKVKICGLQQHREAVAAVRAGADFIGLVFYPPSSRYVTPESARRLLEELRADCATPVWASVGVFVNAPVDWINHVAALCDLDYVQLHGTEPPSYCDRLTRPAIKALRLRELPQAPLPAAAYGAARLLLDSEVPGYWGGSGKRFDWTSARPHAHEAFVAGGLTPANVTEALATLDPWGLDVSSGVESNGVK
jgi:phosphoribosylanthranilate isomerase